MIDISYPKKDFVISLNIFQVPKFADKRAFPLSVSSNFKPGRYAAGRTYNVTYTAADKYGNKAYCSFSFQGMIH